MTQATPACMPRRSSAARDRRRQRHARLAAPPRVQSLRRQPRVARRGTPAHPAPPQPHPTCPKHAGA
eukprot:7329383-Alexandrium_andersonii.AAC.1